MASSDERSFVAKNWRLAFVLVIIVVLTILTVKNTADISSTQKRSDRKQEQAIKAAGYAVYLSCQHQMVARAVQNLDVFTRKEGGVFLAKLYICDTNIGTDGYGRLMTSAERAAFYKALKTHPERFP